MNSELKTMIDEYRDGARWAVKIGDSSNWEFFSRRRDALRRYDNAGTNEYIEGCCWIDRIDELIAVIAMGTNTYSIGDTICASFFDGVTGIDLQVIARLVARHSREEQVK